MTAVVNTMTAAVNTLMADVSVTGGGHPKKKSQIQILPHRGQTTYFQIHDTLYVTFQRHQTFLSIKAKNKRHFIQTNSSILGRITFYNLRNNSDGALRRTGWLRVQHPQLHNGVKLLNISLAMELRISQLQNAQFVLLVTERLACRYQSPVTSHAGWWLNA